MRLAYTMIVTLTLGGCILQPTETPDCAGTASCDGCVGRAGCGWCEATRACVPGSSFGPDEGSCLPASWRSTSCANPPGGVDGCHEEAECGGCLYVLGDGDPDCRWCPSTGECLNRDETCSVGTSTTDYDLCRVSNCLAQTSCSGCTSMGSDCRWCDQGGGGSCTETYDCDPHYEFGSGDRCPPPNDCSMYFGCETCVGQPGCGWCDSPGDFGHCVAVDGFGDYAGWCFEDDLALDAFQCPE